MKRLILPILVILPLFLVGCASNDSYKCITVKNKIAKGDNLFIIDEKGTEYMLSTSIYTDQKYITWKEMTLNKTYTIFVKNDQLSLLLDEGCKLSN